MLPYRTASSSRELSKSSELSCIIERSDIALEEPDTLSCHRVLPSKCCCNTRYSTAAPCILSDLGGADHSGNQRSQLSYQALSYMYHQHLHVATSLQSQRALMIDRPVVARTAIMSEWARQTSVRQSSCKSETSVSYSNQQQL